MTDSTTLPAASLLAASALRRDAGDSLGALAYQRIRDRIIALDLPPAAVIDERQLAEEMELGLTPVRTALRRLALEKLVVVLPRRGTLVADLNLADIHKIFEMRIELEALAARLAAGRATPAQKALLADLAAETRRVQAEGRAGGAPDNRRLIDLDRRLHRLLAEAAHNEFLLETLDWLYGHVLRLWNLSLHRVRGLDDSMEEHCQVADAVLRGDAAEAGARMRAHVQHFQSQFLSV